MGSTPAIASASAAFTPTAVIGGRATDNSGDRPEEMGPRSATTANAAAGGRLLFSRPIWSVSLEGLGEYEHYLSAPARNTGATGTLDARWRPDERTYLRSRARITHSPDRWDPEVPYQLAISSADGDELPAFIRVTTTRWSQGLLLDHRATELWRLRATGAVTQTTYGERRLGDLRDERFEARALQSRTVLETGFESLWITRETVEAGLFADVSRADYEVTSDAWTADAGGVLEWTIAERLSFHARMGPDWTTMPGSNLPDRWGFTADASLIRRWTLAEVELSGREGTFHADATIPAARRSEGKLTLRALPFEGLSFEAFVGAGTERSQYERYHAIGTARTTTAGTSLRYALTEYVTARAGYQYAAVETTGRIEVPYRSNTVFLGMTFTGWNFGSPAPETNRSPSHVERGAAQ